MEHNVQFISPPKADLLKLMVMYYSDKITIYFLIVNVSHHYLISSVGVNAASPFTPVRGNMVRGFFAMPRSHQRDQGVPG